MRVSVYFVAIDGSSTIQGQAAIVFTLVSLFLMIVIFMTQLLWRLAPGWLIRE
jgi:hypothetical protein